MSDTAQAWNSFIESWEKEYKVLSVDHENKCIAVNFPESAVQYMYLFLVDFDALPQPWVIALGDTEEIPEEQLQMIQLNEFLDQPNRKMTQLSDEDPKSPWWGYLQPDEENCYLKIAFPLGSCLAEDVVLALVIIEETLLSDDEEDEE